MKKTKSEDFARKLYKQITGCVLIDSPVKCPKCDLRIYVYDKKRYGVFCKCGYGVKEKDLIEHLWGTQKFDNINYMANFYVYGIMQPSSL